MTTTTTIEVEAPVRSVLICGYGLMGRGVGNTFAGAGFKVSVRSSRADALKGTRPDIVFLRDLPEAPPDLILELVPEDLETKRALFREIEARYGDADFLLATGTSGLDLNALAEGLKRPERLIAIITTCPPSRSRWSRWRPGRPRRARPSSAPPRRSSAPASCRSRCTSRWSASSSTGCSTRSCTRPTG